MARYFVHLPPNGSAAIFWRRVQGFARVQFHINLNLLAHAVGDDPASLLPQGGRLVPSQNYAFGNGADESINLQPFAFTLPGSDPNLPEALPIGPKLQRFLDDPLSGKRLDLSLPFYNEDIKLEDCWVRNFNDGSAFHAGNDFETIPHAVFDVCAAATGEVLSMAAGCIVLSHTTPDGPEFRTVYQHMNLDSVRHAEGDSVRSGEFLGQTADHPTSIHLHFGVAVAGPSFTSSSDVHVPELWYFIDPWGVYDFHADNYLPRNGRIYEAPIARPTRTVQWRAQPVFKTIPIARSTGGYRDIVRVQVRARRGDNLGGTFPPEHEQFLVWLEGDPDLFWVPLAQASNLTAELELVDLLREAFYHGKRVQLEYRYAGDLRYIMAAWVGA